MAGSEQTKSSASRQATLVITEMNKRLYTAAIIKTGLIVGALDILFAFANAWWSAGVPSERVLRFIASGLIGKKAFQGLPLIALLGLAIHFFIAFFWTIVFFELYPKLKTVIRNRFWQGVLYGIFIWCMMNLVILPVSNTPKLQLHLTDTAKGILILIVAMGCPLAYLAGRYYRVNIER